MAGPRPAFIFGLVNPAARKFNFQPGLASPTIPSHPPTDEPPRYAVTLRGGHTLAVRPQHLLWADSDADRARYLVMVSWQTQVGLRTARQFLLTKLSGELGLCLMIASHFAQFHSHALYHFSGFNRRFFSECFRLKIPALRREVGAAALHHSHCTAPYY